MRVARTVAIAIAATTLLLPASAGAGSTDIGFSVFPKRAVQGDPTGVALSVPRSGDICTLRVTYANGAVQGALRAHVVRSGRVAWAWKVPPKAHTGRAGVSVQCKASGRVARPLMVVGAVVPPKIVVVKQGFSLRTPKYGGDSVSYGVILSNRSQTDDALDVSVLVNFVNANNVLIGSATKQLASIRAGGQYALGDALTFPAAAPVARLEVVVRVGGRQPTSGPVVPSLDNIRIVPDTRDPIWVASIEGEISNRAPKQVLVGATISAIVMDAAGNVVGGGTGSVAGTLPPGAREFVKLISGLASIPTANAVTAQFSIVPRYDERV